MKTILIVSPEAWGAHTVSKHHYAMTLATLGARIYFLNPPDDSIKGVRIEAVNSRPGLFIVSAGKVAPGLRFLPSAIRQKLEIRWLKAFERHAGVLVDIIWLFENSRFFDLSFAGNRLKIYHQVDLNQIFNVKLAAETADICFCTTDLIREKLLEFNERVYKIHHGLAQGYAQVSLTEEQLARLKKGAPVKAMYVGNLDIQYLDIDLLLSVVKKFENVDFHFIGGYRVDGPLWQRCGQLPNVTWWGKVDSSLILPLLDMADMLLVTYKEEHWEDQASPHKFMEYLASGKVIVSTYIDEYKNKRHLVEMVDQASEFLQVFERVLGRLGEFNEKRNVAERQAFALDHTYERQVNRIDTFLRSNDLPTIFTN